MEQLVALPAEDSRPQFQHVPPYMKTQATVSDNRFHPKMSPVYRMVDVYNTMLSSLN